MFLELAARWVLTEFISHPESFGLGGVGVGGVGGLHGPDVPLKVASICSSVLPLVSGMNAMVKMMLRVHMEANSQKVPALVRRFCKSHMTETFSVIYSLTLLTACECIVCYIHFPQGKETTVSFEF